jgi:O-antigen ligase
MNELINIDTYKTVNTNYSTGLRVGIYKCVYGLAKDNWIFGYGPGNTQEVLNECYASNSSVLLDKIYNSHNQYLDVLLKTGIFGLLMFLSFLIINYVKAKENKNFIVTYILIFYCIIFIIENILLRQSGIILFYFFITFFNKVDSLKHNGNATAKYL